MYKGLLTRNSCYSDFVELTLTQITQIESFILLC